MNELLKYFFQVMTFFYWSRKGQARKVIIGGVVTVFLTGIGIYVYNANVACPNKVVEREAYLVSWNESLNDTTSYLQPCREGDGVPAMNAGNQTGYCWHTRDYVITHYKEEYLNKTVCLSEGKEAPK